MMDGMFSSLLGKKKHEWGIDRNLDDVACRSGFSSGAFSVLAHGLSFVP